MKILLFYLTLSAMPIMAITPDEEIIKNLDFFQNMDLIKEEKTLSFSNNLNDSIGNLEIKSENSHPSFPSSEKKQ